MLCKTASKKDRLWGLKGGIILALSAFLFSCSSHSNSTTSVREVKINLIADKDINPNESGHSAPLNIFIYDVKDRDVFTNADFFEIVDGKNSALQAAASQEYEAILQPGESRTITIKPNAVSRGLGFVGAYRDLNNAVWLVTWPLTKKKETWWSNLFSSDSLSLTVSFHKAEIAVKKMD